MFLFGYALAAMSFLIPPPPERPTSQFDLAVCGANATDIVVTDTDGRVLESWRGELKPGDAVRLGPARLTPANALAWECLRLRPERTLNGLCCPPVVKRPRHTFDHTFGSDEAVYEAPQSSIIFPSIADTERRLVLFLRKEGTPGVGTVWMPAAAPPTRQQLAFTMSSRRDPVRSYAVFDPNPDFTASVACAEAGRVVALKQEAGRPQVLWEWDAAPRPATLAFELKHFKSEALATPTPPSDSTAPAPPRAVEPSFNSTLENFGARLWAEPRK